MKIGELLEEVIWSGEGDDEDIELVAYLNEGGVRIGFRPKGGGIVRKAAQGAMKFITNPVVAGMVAGYAMDAIRKYKSNKKYTSRFFAADSTERRFYEKMIKDLMATGHYRMVSQKYVGGGYLWELKRLR
jgi:hypothetical protein